MAVEVKGGSGLVKENFRRGHLSSGAPDLEQGGVVGVVKAMYQVVEQGAPSKGLLRKRGSLILNHSVY